MLRNSSLVRAMPVRRSLRRRSMTALLDVDPVDGAAEAHTPDATSLAVLHDPRNAATLFGNSPSSSRSVSASVTRSQFAYHFQSHRDRFEAAYGSSASHVLCGAPETTARQELENVHSTRRALFTQHTPVVRLPKHKALLRQERAAAAREAAHKRAGAVEEDGGHATVAAVPRRVDPFVDVPLLPAAFIRQEALRTAGVVPRSDDGHDEAARLQLATTRNHLVQTGGAQLFRCLRCFHVFSAEPSTIFKSKVQQTRLELDEQQRNRAHAMSIARRPSRRKRLSSVARQRDDARRDPDTCPSCRSTALQWAMEYVHHRTHHKLPTSR